jgi:hypothetical protein
MDTPGQSSEGSVPPPDTIVTPEWVLANHQQQQEVNAQIMASLRAIQQATANATIQHPQESTPAPITEVPVLNGPVSDPFRRPKHSLSHPEKYDGESKTAYPAFKGHLRAKLRIDQAAIGGEAEQVWYGFGRLSGKAAERIFPWIEATDSQQKPLRVQDFFDQLDAAFYDAQSPQRALEWINTKRQGSTPFREFLQDFEQKLLEAGGWEFSDGIRKGYLKAALNLELRKQLVARDEPKVYSDFVNLVRKASDDLDQIKRMEKTRNNWVSTRQPKSTDRQDAMDWEPTPRTASGSAPNPRRGNNDRPRAKWVSQTVFDQRRTDGACFRCGDLNHRTIQCRYAAALPPNGNRPQKTSSSTQAAPEDAPVATKVKSTRPKGKKENRTRVEEVSESDYESFADSENE